VVTIIDSVRTTSSA